jgi:uncharacterized protein (DUF2236 family)
MSVIEDIKDRITRTATSVFKHADYPLARTLDHPGDPGICGPGSVSWEVIGDTATFVGGIRALLIQAAHPEVAAGVADHSRYRQDPLGRLSRTSNYVTATTFGAMPEVQAAVSVVEKMHRRVRGTSHRGEAYAADTPDLAAWVHNALTESFLTTHQIYGRRHLTDADADRFVAEQAAIGRLLHADPVPETAAALSRWIHEHPAAGDSPGRRDAIDFLRKPPLHGGLGVGYKLLFRGAVATIPRRMRRLLGVRRVPGAIVMTRLVTRFLRWALGSSPSWNLALVRVGAEIPEGVFRQPLPIETLDEWGTARSADSEQRTVDPSG